MYRLDIAEHNLAPWSPMFIQISEAKKKCGEAFSGKCYEKFANLLLNSVVHYIYTTQLSSGNAWGGHGFP